MTSNNEGRSPTPSSADGRSPLITIRTAELAVAAFTALVGVVVMKGSYAQGIGWSDSGPESGYFPFYIGLFMLVASLGTIAVTLKNWKPLKAAFVEREPLRHVLRVFVPIVVYGIGIRLLGMYLASAIFIGWFMWSAGEEQRHARWKIVVVPLAVVLASYLIFERWFQVPLYAGPLLEHFGIGQ